MTETTYAEQRAAELKMTVAEYRGKIEAGRALRLYREAQPVRDAYLRHEATPGYDDLLIEAMHIVRQLEEAHFGLTAPGGWKVAVPEGCPPFDPLKYAQSACADGEAFLARARGPNWVKHQGREVVHAYFHDPGCIMPAICGYPLLSIAPLEARLTGPEQAADYGGRPCKHCLRMSKHHGVHYVPERHNIHDY